MTPIISLRGIGKKYRIRPTSRASFLKEVLTLGKANRSHDFWALQDVDLDVEPGTTLGVLGRNGAGKSTLLSIISGVLQPSTGQVTVEGRMTAIFGVGAGFNPQFTGRENVMLNGLILGIDHDEMVERFDDIAAFADIGEFIDQPIKTYSSGMRSRLGFAVAVNVEPDVLVLDEALSAGDAAFKKKALQRMYDLRDSGTTVLFVSHSMGMVQRFCSEAVLLHRGRMVGSGTPDEVVGQYREILEKAQERKDAKADAKADEREQQLDYTIEHEDEEDTPIRERAADRDEAELLPRATGDAEVLGVDLLDERQEEVGALASGASVTVRVHLRYAKAVEDGVLGIALRSKKADLDVFVTDTAHEGVPLGPKEQGERVTVDFTFDVPLQPGPYGVDVAMLRNGDSYPDRAEEAAVLEVTQDAGGESPGPGLVRLPARVEIHGPQSGRESPSRSA